ncbi:MAG: glycosyltransferase family 4 protein [Leadbetterella sp.]
MEVLFVSHKFPPSTGGMEKQSYELINGMKSHGKVHVIVPAENENKILFFLKLKSRILGFLKANPTIKTIHFNDALIATVCLGHKEYTHLKRIVTVHGLDVVFPNAYYQTKLLPRFNRFDTIIAVSEATAQACIDRGIDKNKVVVIPNGVDHEIGINLPSKTEIDAILQKLGIDPHRPLLVGLGRAVKRKGFSWFSAEVVPKLPKNVQVVWIGPFHKDATMLEKILGLLPKKLSRQLELALGFPTDEKQLRELLKQESNIKHLGKLPWKELEIALASATAFVMPNIAVEGDMEGFGLVCLEAGLCGTTVLAANIDGIPSAVHTGKNGVLLPNTDVEAWRQTIDMLISENCNRTESTASQRAYIIQTFGWKKMVSQYAQIFE